MPHPLYQIDAFTNTLFRGNPAALVLLDAWLDEKTMLDIAAENNLAETAFLLKKPDGWHIRYFTPRAEINLCGHATLAAAHLLFSELDEKDSSIALSTHLAGQVRVARQMKGREEWYALDFPSWPPRPVNVPPEMLTALKLKPEDVRFAGRERDYMIVLENEAMVAGLQPVFGALAKIPEFVCVTAPAAAGRNADFVSRFFTPQDGIDEDPVTGSAHCMLTPYWASQMGKQDFRAHQISARGGALTCRLAGNRVEIGGQAVTYMKGQVFLT